MSRRGGVCVSFNRLFWLLSVCLGSLVQAQVSVISLSAPIHASVGGDVILPCHLSPAVNAEALTVEWSRTELRPHPSDRFKRVPYVHIYRDRREDTDMKIPDFIGRTELFPDQLRVGNVSLWIRNVTLSDNGTYRCHVPNLRSKRREARVSLIVDSVVDVMSSTESPDVVPKQQDTDTATEPQDRAHWPLVLFIFFVVAVMVLFGFCQVKSNKTQCSRDTRCPLFLLCALNQMFSETQAKAVSLSSVMLSLESTSEQRFLKPKSTQLPGLKALGPAT